MNFFSDISLFWLIPFCLICIGLSYWYYHGQSQLKELKKHTQWALMLLRSLSLFLIGLLLFGIIFERKETRIEKPVFIVMTDNSTSLLNYADSSVVKNHIKDIHAQLNKEFKDRFEIRNYTVGAQVLLDSVSLAEEESNLNNGFDFIYNEFYNRNIGGICFISDGNFNQGANPIYGAEKINFTPIFTIGVGDTIVKRDQLLRNVTANNIAFYKNQFPIEVNIEAHKMGRTNTEVSLWKGDVKMDSKTINFTDGNLDFVNVSFLVDANEIGFVSYTVKLKEEAKESSFENNRRSVYVEVIDSRSKILMVANAPHPDITAIKQELDKDENMEVSTVLLNEWDGKLNGYSLVVWHNPTENGASLYNAIKNTKTPALYLLGLNTSRSFVDKMNLGISLPASNSNDQVQGAFTDEFQLFDISNPLKSAIKRWQPLTVPFGNINQNGNNALIKQKIGAVVKETPILCFNSNQGGKRGILIGEGLWKWKLSDYSQSGSNILFNELIQKTTQYLTVKTNLEPLRINLPNRLTSKEAVIINGEFYNSSFEPIIEPDLKFQLVDSKGVETEYTFGKNTKDYTLDLGSLREGIYQWRAQTTFSGQKYLKTGSFIVENSSIEDLATHANHNILAQIASKSNGQFYELNNTSNLLKDIKTRKDIANVSYQESNFLDLIDWKLLLFLIAGLLSLEWFIRRYSGAY